MDELELRIMLGRLLDHFERWEEATRSMYSLLQTELRRLDKNRSKRLPRTRDMIAAVMRAAGNVGLTRAEVIAAVHRDYGVQLVPNNATTCLRRMQEAGLVRLDGQFWFLI